LKSEDVEVMATDRSLWRGHAEMNYRSLKLNDCSITPIHRELCIEVIFKPSLNFTVAANYY